jgi:hypothetical protein
MKIGIIGAGMIGGTLGPLWARAGHEVRYGTRHPERVTVGDRMSSATPLEAAAFGDAVLLAVPFGATRGVASEIGTAISSKLLMDAGNPYPQREPEVAAEVAAGGRGSGCWTARQFLSAHVVKAFNTVYYRTLQEHAGRTTDPVGIPLAGDDPLALAMAEQLVRDAGFVPVIVGPLDAAAGFDVGTPMWNSNATADMLRAHFRGAHGGGAVG